MRKYKRWPFEYWRNAWNTERVLRNWATFIFKRREQVAQHTSAKNLG